MPNEYLGKMAKDKVTGFTGVVTGYVEYITGCNQCLLAPRSEDGSKLPDVQWIDVVRLEFFSTGRIVLDTPEAKGCDRAAPKR